MLEIKIKRNRIEGKKRASQGRIGSIQVMDKGGKERESEVCVLEKGKEKLKGRKERESQNRLQCRYLKRENEGKKGRESYVKLKVSVGKKWYKEKGGKERECQDRTRSAQEMNEGGKGKVSD